MILTMKTKGYKEWVSEDKISIITNTFGRILYVNPDWPDGEYQKWEGSTHLHKELRARCRKGREFNMEELTLELL